MHGGEIMAAGIVSVYEAKEGRSQELTTILLEAATYMSAVGDGRSHVRNSWLAGPDSGHLQLITLFPTAASLHEGLDLIVADAANNPVGRAFNSTDSPATLRSRLTMQTLDPERPVPEPASILTSYRYRVTEGSGEEAHKAFAAAENFGPQANVAPSIAWRFTNAGPAAGLMTLTSAAESYADFHDQTTKLVATGPLPLPAARATGAITYIGQSSSILVAG